MLNNREEIIDELNESQNPGIIQSNDPEQQMNRYYFLSSLVSFSFGMVVTIIALNITSNPQPALLYILPAMVLFYIGAAFLKKETIKMIFYDEDEEISKFEISLKINK